MVKTYKATMGFRLRCSQQNQSIDSTCFIRVEANIWCFTGTFRPPRCWRVPFRWRSRHLLRPRRKVAPRERPPFFRKSRPSWRMLKDVEPWLYIATKNGEANMKRRETKKSVDRTSMNQFFVGGMSWDVEPTIWCSIWVCGKLGNVHDMI